MTWRDRAACKDAPNEYFFSAGHHGYSYAKARAICESCPVREPCLQYAVENFETEGMWGGKTPRERRELRTQNPPVVECWECGSEFLAHRGVSRFCSDGCNREHQNAAELKRRIDYRMPKKGRLVYEEGVA